MSKFGYQSLGFGSGAPAAGGVGPFTTNAWSADFTDSNYWSMTSTITMLEDFTISMWLLPDSATVGDAGDGILGHTGLGAADTGTLFQWRAGAPLRNEVGI